MSFSPWLKFDQGVIFKDVIFGERKFSCYCNFFYKINHEQICLHWMSSCRRRETFVMCLYLGSFWSSWFHESWAYLVFIYFCCRLFSSGPGRTAKISNSYQVFWNIYKCSGRQAKPRNDYFHMQSRVLISLSKLRFGLLSVISLAIVKWKGQVQKINKMFSCILVFSS